MKYFSILLVVFLGWLACGCEQEVSLVGVGDPVPVVYGIFDPADTIHYIKLTKSFSGEASIDELIARQDFYYPDAAVSIVEKASQKAFNLVKIIRDGKEPGLFPTNPYPVYALEGSLQTGQYELQIESNAEDVNLHQTFRVVDGFTVLYPSALSKRIYFYDDPISFVWSSNPNIYSYEIAYTLEFEELTDSISLKSITYTRAVNEEELEWMQGRWKFRLYSDPFFGKIGQSLTNSEGVHYRKPINIRLRITGMDEELTQFMKQTNSDTQVETSYTGNLEGAIGIIASKYSLNYPNLQLSPKAMDSLRSGRFTRNLKFISNPDW